MYGILTFQDTTNYGAALQAYALMITLKKNNVDCEIIDYKCPALQQRYKIIQKYNNIKDYVKATLLAVPNFRLKKKFELFYNDNFILSEVITPDIFKNKMGKYKGVIVGSDQVWNPKLTNNDLNYFLPLNIGIRKISYAASFGGFSDEKILRKLYTSYISDFEAISLRELDTLNYIEEKVDVKQVLDPTLLLTKDEWNKLLISKRLVKEKYILVYKMMDTDDLFDFAKRLAKITGLKIIYVTHSVKYIYGMKNIFVVTPEEFLNYMFYAEYIVTSSFHGVAFSINFNKQFYYSLDQHEVKHNSRINSIINLFNLKDRYTKNFKDIDNNIKWTKVNSILDVERKKSLDFLINSLSKF